MSDIVDPAERIEQLLAAAEPALANAFARMIAAIKSKLTLEGIADAIGKGRWEAALDEALKAAPIIGEAYQDAFIAAARDTATFLGRSLGEVQLVFDRVNYSAVNAMQRNMLRLVQGFSASQRDLVRGIILDGIQRGVNPREIAKLFRDSIGLTPFQERAVRNYQRALQDLDPAALQRMLRDKRFDRTIQAALDANRPLSPDQIDKMVSRYRAKMLSMRAETIARTEALRSTHEGVKEMYDQAIARGELSPDSLSQEWNTAADERVRTSHAPMNGQTRPYGVPFLSGAGNELKYPGDPDAPPEEVINCRCSVGMRITRIAGVLS